MHKLGVGVVGIGQMGRRHAENLRRLVPEARLVAVADTDRERARSVAGELEVENWYDRVEEMVAQSDLDAVVISSPPRFHPGAVQVAAAARKHILCEKPLALTLEEADTLVEAVARAGVYFQTGHMRRYDRAYAAARQRIEAGEIGDPIIFKAIGRDPEAAPASAFQAGWVSNLFLDSSVHEFDLARWLMNDEVVEVAAFTAALACPELTRFGAFDAGVVNLRFARGGIGNVESFMNAGYGYDIRTEIVGTKGTLQVGYLRQTPFQILTRTGGSHDVVDHWLVRFAEAYVNEMRDFVRRVLAGLPPSITIHDGRQAVAVALAAERSARESRLVRLEP